MSKPTVSQQIKELHSKASELASKEVIRLARKTMAADATLEEFIMGMGTWYFKDANGLIYDENDKRFAEIEAFISEWDNELRITGEPMRFTPNGPIVRNW